jgi:hypothetical protein
MTYDRSRETVGCVWRKMACAFGAFPPRRGPNARAAKSTAGSARVAGVARPSDSEMAPQALEKAQNGLGNGAAVGPVPCASVESICRSRSPAPAATSRCGVAVEVRLPQEATPAPHLRRPSRPAPARKARRLALRCRRPAVELRSQPVERKRLAPPHPSILRERSCRRAAGQGSSPLRMRRILPRARAMEANRSLVRSSPARRLGQFA